jgi:putative OmpL-like beta-barrel porin-2
MHLRDVARALFVAGFASGVPAVTGLAADETPAPPKAEAPAPPAPAAAAPEAAKETPKPAVPALGDILDAAGITVNGYVDVAYSYLTGKGLFAVPDTSPPVALGANRVFDTEHSSFNLHQAAITVAKQPKEGFGALVNLTAGKDVKIIKSFDQTSDNFDVTQAFIQYATGPLTVIGGKFVTLAGAEVINPTADTNYSRSILFGFAIPFTHTGLRLTYALNDMVSLIGGVNNGWDQFRDANTPKTAELGVTLTLSKALSISASGYSGKEPLTTPVGGQPVDPHQGRRDLIDLVATFNATDKLTFILNYDYGWQHDCITVNCPAIAPGTTGTANWQGIAGYVNYQLADQWRLSFRAEYFDDHDGYRTGIAQKWTEETLTLAYLPTKHIELRAEVRADQSNKSSFLKTDLLSTSKNQESFAVEGIYKF